MNMLHLDNFEVLNMAKNSIYSIVWLNNKTNPNFSITVAILNYSGAHNRWDI